MNPTITQDINNARNGQNIAFRLHRIYEYSIVPEVKDSLKAELSASSYKRIEGRIPDVNIIKQLVNKLAKVYDKDAMRKTNEGDQKRVEYYEEAMCLDLRMRTANMLLELTKLFALEPYMSPEGPRIRVLAPYQFKAHSDDPDDPTRMTAFTKFLPDEVVQIPANGFNPPRQEVYRMFRTYFHDQIVTWGWNEKDKKTFTRESVANPVKMIPFVYGNASEFEITPESPESDIECAVLIPKTYADLYYALKFSCHSVTVTLDCTIPDGAEWAPDTVVEAQSTETDGKQGKVEVLKPEADIDTGLSLIQDTVVAYLESKGIKPPQTNMRLERPNAAAAMIENADASSHIMKRCSFFKSIETQLWKLIATLHNEIWSKVEVVPEGFDRAAFSKGMKVEVQFGEVKPVEIRSEHLDRLEKQLKLGLMSRKQALQELYPNFTKQQLEAWLQEAGDDNEVLRKAAETLVGKPTPAGGPGNNPADQNQDPQRDGSER